MRESEKQELFNNQMEKINKEYKEFVEFKKTIQPKKEAIRFSFIYLLVGCLWILFSDRLALLASGTQEVFQYIQLLKGWFYVVASGAFFAWMVYKRMRLFELAINELVKEYELLTLADEELIAMDDALQEQYEEITQQKNELMISQERYNLAVEGANDGIWEWDIEGSKFFVSPKVLEIIGELHQDENDSPNILLKHIHPEEVERVQDSLEEYLSSQSGIYEDQYRLRIHDGTYMWISSHGKAIWNTSGQAIRIAGSYTNITEQMENQEKLHQLAFYDSLTGLANRTMMSKLIDQKIKEHVKENYKIGFLYLDIDDFKQINDAIGHGFGDEFIIKIARFLKEEIGPKALVARLGGDEFGIALMGMNNIGQVEEMAKSLLERIKQPWTVGDNTFYVGVSIGITYYPEFANNAAVLMQNGDTAMFAVKEEGKNAYKLYRPEMRQKTWDYIKMNGLLRTAIENNEFSLYYQPQVELDNYSVIGVEALIRWNHPSEGFISPMEFIPFAEDTGQIYPIGEWVVNTACAKKRFWEKSGLENLKMSINISSKRLAQEDVVVKIKREIERHQLSGCCVELEITETAVVNDLDRAIEVLNELKELGVTIALDDFGTGYSSLTYLQKLPIDILKVDREFIKSIIDANEESYIFRFITELAHGLGLKVVAEGVETKEQLAFLKNNGCDIAQGYYFSRPVPSDTIETVIDQINDLKHD